MTTSAPMENGKKVLTMAEYIEREDLLELYRMDDPVLNENGHVPLPVIRQNIMDIPAADVAPVQHGRWLHTEEPLGWQDVDCMECSACHDSWIIGEDYCFDDMPLWNYCPSCGAKMDGAE